MDSKDLNELAELFAHSGDALVLLCLARDIEAADGQPRGFAQLARAIVDYSGSYIPDGTIVRSLKHLQADGLVHARDANTRHPTYSLTDRGTEKAAVLTVLLTAMRNWRESKEDASPP